MGIVTAAAGRRDGYQVPVALAEAGLLDAHVTDRYLPDSIAPLVGTIAKRTGIGPLEGLARSHHDQLPSQRVHCSRRLLFTKAAQRLKPSLRQRWSDDQDPISWSALRQAQRHDSALLLHMGYAHHAFMAEKSASRKRGLVQYHPHIGESARILLADLDRYPVLTDAREQLKLDQEDRSNQVELERADLVICNSSFTARTCQVLGVESSRLQVIPFGIDIHQALMPTPQMSRRESCHFLFVGSGLHRKGLHHLIEAWQKANLSHSQLTLVCRSIDPQIRATWSLPKGIHFCSAVSQSELEQLYQQADVFVLPSLVEGFGYVYLEALARGCFCLGTWNTGLPDVADQSSAMLIPAAQPAELAKALIQLESRAFGQGFNREVIAASILRWSWSRFRNDAVAVAQQHLLQQKEAS